MRHEHVSTATFGRRALAAAAGLVAVTLATAVLPAPALGATAAPPRRIVSGWLPYWSSAASTASVVANADLFTDVSPFWYAAHRSGNVSSIEQQVSNSSKSTYLPQLQAAGIRVLPTITDGMAAHSMAATLSTVPTRTAFVNQIVSLVVSNGYDGIDLDFEGFAFKDGRSTWATTRPLWVAFVKQLGAGLHAHGKLLSVTTGYLTSPTTGYWVYDWAGIGPSIDRLRVMTYDYHVSAAGPIAPFSWVDAVAKFAASQVASGKVQIGVASYGRDWRTATTYSGVVSTCPTTGPAGATAPQTQSLVNAIAFSKVTHTFDAASVGSYVSTFRAGNFTAPGIALLKAPVPIWDSVNKERTFATQLRFSGRASQSVGTTATAALGGKALVVASVAGLATGLVVTGTGIATGTTVTSIVAATRTITLSLPTTAAVSGAVRFAGLVPVSCTISRTAWYDDASAATARAALVGTYHLGGIAQWTIGGEDQRQWSQLRSYARSIAPTPTVVGMRTSSRAVYGTPWALPVVATAAGLPVSGATATFQLLLGGRWVTAGQATTSSAGRVTFIAGIKHAVRYRVIVGGTFDRVTGVTQGVVGMRTRVTVTPASSGVRPGHASRVSVRLAPAVAGQRTTLQVRTSTGWHTLRTAVADRAGRVTYSVAPTARHASTSYRVAAYAVGSIAGNYGYFVVRLA